MMTKDESRKQAVKNEFSNKIGRLTKSIAYLDYCEEVYGYRMYLFNMMDKQQLDFVFNSIPLSAGDTLLDLGCGAGSVLAKLAEKYGCRGIGIDLLDDAIVKANCRNSTYIDGDIETFTVYGIKPTVTLSIDSLYFGADIDNLLRNLHQVENNKCYLFYSQYIFDETAADKSVLKSDRTVLAQVLDKNQIPYKTVDYSDNERNLYENSLRVLQKQKAAFVSEGNADLFENKWNEDSFGKELYDKGLARRYMYIIDTYV